MADTADAHWKLALWCEQNGLKPEATAHLTRVVQLDPGRDAAWRRLGYRKQGRRWVTDEQVAAEKAEEVQEGGRPALAADSGSLAELDRRQAKERAGRGPGDGERPARRPVDLGDVRPREAPHQKAAVQLLGQIDSPDATRALALLALDGKSPEVRARAAQTLRLRDPREIASMLIAMLRDPELDPDPILFHYRLTPVAWDSVTAPGIL